MQTRYTGIRRIGDSAKNMVSGFLGHPWEGRPEMRKSAERSESRSTRMKLNAMRLKTSSARQNAATGSAG